MLPSFPHYIFLFYLETFEKVPLNSLEHPSKITLQQSLKRQPNRLFSYQGVGPATHAYNALGRAGRDTLVGG